MVSASLAQVRGISVREGGRLELPRLRSELSQAAQPVFTWDPSSETELSSSPLLRDPYEAQVLAVSQSSVAGAGRGVFARVDIRDVWQSSHLSLAELQRGSALIGPELRSVGCASNLMP